MPNKIPAELMVCRVCGLAQETPPWGRDGLSPSFEICPCCGTEFGYDDATRVAVLRRRARWAQTGYAWFDPVLRPPGWRRQEQMGQIPPDFIDDQA
jgi:hypothetical protein